MNAVNGRAGSRCVAGVLCACALAWGAVRAAGEKGAGAGAPGLEHTALAFGREYIDGPALEASSEGHKAGDVDAAGNLYMRGGPVFAIRVLTPDGMIRTIAGDDRYLPNTEGCPDEGPACMLPSGDPTSLGYGREGAILRVIGLPMEGEDKGCLYASHIGDYPCKVFKNKEKNDRWWYRFVGKGSVSLPTTVGASVDFKDVDLKGVILYGTRFHARGFLYEWNGRDGKITCRLTVGDYGDKCLHWKTGKALGAADQAVMGDDGTMYVLYYGKSYPHGQIYRISKDRGKVEKIVECVKGGKDGPGLQSGWHCGPLLIKNVVDDTLIISSVDSTYFRRWKNGRISTICEDDGEWREVYGTKSSRRGFKARDYVFSPQTGYVYVTYPGEDRGGITYMYRFGPVDVLKDTVGPLLKGK